MNNKFFNIVSSVLSYSPHDKYYFTLPETPEEKGNSTDMNFTQTIPEELKPKDKQGQSIYESLDVNLDYLKVKYNSLINSDIILREFTLTAKNKEFKALLVYIDGMVNSKMINDFVLEPLMLKNKSNTNASLNDSTLIAVAGNISIKRHKKFSLENYIYNSLIPQNSIHKESEFAKIISDINSGNCALFIDTLSQAFSIEVKGFQARSVTAPKNEVVVKGAQEAFVESIRVNTSLLRRIINNEDLIIESCDVGTITRTKIAICYVKNIANDELVGEVKYRINNLDIDTLVSSRSARTVYTR